MINKLRNVLAVALLGVMPSVHAQTPSSAYSWSHLPTAELPVFKNDTINVLNYGAKPDGISLNTKAINAAITACSEKGGGVVLIPQGLWLSGPIEMKSNVNLHIDRAAVLQFTADKAQYALMEGNFEGHKALRNQSPISGTDLVNIAITGEGIIDGHGEAWRAMNKSSVTEGQWKALVASGGVVSDDGNLWYPSKSYAKGAKMKQGNDLVAGKALADFQDVKDFFRPNLLVFNNCKRVLLEGTTFQNSPAWCLHTLQCENMTFRGVRVRNEANAQNGDGMDIESCSNVLVENCTLDCGDDGLCIKSGKDEEGRKVGKASQYIVLRNNVVYKAHGGFVIGSEMSGGAHDIFVTDCSFIGTDNGLRFKTVRGRGGVVENIYVKNISMRNIGHDAVLFDMYYFVKAPTLAQTNGKVDIPAVDEGTPQFRNFYIDGLTCDGAERAMLIRGLPEMSIKNIFLKNVIIKADRGADIIEAQNIKLDDVQLICKNSNPLINIENSQSVTFNNIQTLEKPKQFLSISGDRSKNIDIKNASPEAKSTEVNFMYGAEKSALVSK
ncbi:pectate lyase-like protein [Mucilaginibacter yixingensis]|uniref:Pectate lyase-like protein n=1 Tax=Mucilaginibacter yixingensis TaxID=1295612 RepID=A0A2T5JAI1_9SPHI|nr:glycoside hydrolase family 28 protein [Mucilaginibacter yixingensis]PTQ97873.1 pectate lyase-like protein [Mucilaginibacter yixingensis]